MKALNLLNAKTLDQQTLFIIIGVAAVLLAAIAVIIVCSVRAGKKRNGNVASNTNAEPVKKDVVASAVTQTPAKPVAEVFAETSVAAEEATQEDEPDELAITTDENADDDEETVQLTVDSNGGAGVVYRRIQYRRSFLARLTQADDEVKQRYSILKNYLLSYAKVKPALSWKRERFSVGRNTFACFVLRGKKLCLCFAADPKRFDDTKYKVIDLSVRSPNSKLPCKYRITSERRVKYAQEIIDMLLAELSVEKLTEHLEQNYVMPYRTTEALIEDDLIRVKIIDGVDADDIKEIIKQTEALPKRDFKILPKVEATEVNVMSDAQAAKIIEYKVVKRRKSSKGKKGIVNIDVLSQKFQSGSRITIEALREQHIINNNVNYVKVLANGLLDKPLIVEADDFSLAAVKMIALTGGRVIRTSDK